MRNKLTYCLFMPVFWSVDIAADTLGGVYVGVQGWRSNADGGFSSTESITRFNFDEQTNGTFYIALEHPLPFVPNIKLTRTSLDVQGDSQLSSDFVYGGGLFTNGSRITSDVDLTSTDLTLYYELLDNDVVSFDVGLTGKYFDGTVQVVDSASNTRGMESLSVVVPLLYSRVALGLPFTGWGVYAEGNYLAVGSNRVSDYQVAVTYSFIESLALDMKVQVGYRDITLDLDDVDNTYADVGFDGLFAGIELHF